jgi:hypothetical protein
MTETCKEKPAGTHRRRYGLLLPLYASIIAFNSIPASQFSPVLLSKKAGLMYYFTPLGDKLGNTLVQSVFNSPIILHHL